MSDVLSALIGAGAMWVGIWLKDRLKTRAARRSAERTEQRQASNRERSEARRREQSKTDTQRMEQARLAAQWHALWEQVLRSREHMRGWLDYGRGRRPWSPIDRPMPSVASDRACGVAVLEVPALHPLTVVYHDATVALERALRERMPAGDVDGLQDGWERAFQMPRTGDGHVAGGRVGGATAGSGRCS